MHKPHSKQTKYAYYVKQVGDWQPTAINFSVFYNQSKTAHTI
ncbi:MAG: hypothetical protein Q4B88_06425 [Moraxella sp.]|nr:hypothetical protein [Moraxella sp.]